MSEYVSLFGMPGFHPADVFETEARAEKGMGDEIARMRENVYYLHVYQNVVLFGIPCNR